MTDIDTYIDDAKLARDSILKYHVRYFHVSAKDWESHLSEDELEEVALEHSIITALDLPGLIGQVHAELDRVVEEQDIAFLWHDPQLFVAQLWTAPGYDLPSMTLLIQSQPKIEMRPLFPLSQEKATA